MRIEITRSKVYPSRPRPGPAWSPEPTRLERFGTTDAGFEERILDAEIAAAEPLEEA